MGSGEQVVTRAPGPIKEQEQRCATFAESWGARTIRSRAHRYDQLCLGAGGRARGQFRDRRRNPATPPSVSTLPGGSALRKASATGQRPLVSRASRTRRPAARLRWRRSCGRDSSDETQRLLRCEYVLFTTGARRRATRPRIARPMTEAVPPFSTVLGWRLEFGQPPAQLVWPPGPRPPRSA
jgi:hypothetical protein